MKGKIGEFYNIGSNINLNNLQVVNHIINVVNKKINLNKKIKIKFVKDRPGHDFRYAINSDKILKKLKWKPKYTFKDGIYLTFKWYYEIKIFF